jgi:hypothetical protein
MEVTHICLIGDDPTANLTPVLESGGLINRLLIVYQKKQLEALEALTQIAKTRGCKVDCWLMEEGLSTENIKLEFMRLYENEIKKGAFAERMDVFINHYRFNASNGSRQQVLSAYEISRSYHVPIYIVEQKSDSLCWLYPEARPTLQVSDKIKIHEFLTINQCCVTSQKRSEELTASMRLIGGSWLSKIQSLASGLSKLNYLASSADNPRLTARQNSSMQSDESLQWLLDELGRNDLIKFNGMDIDFLSERSRFFCNGGWLEETTFAIAKGLRGVLPAIQDVAHSVEVDRKIDGKNVRNELDVVALVNNKLHVIECKTKRFDAGDGNETIYKLDSIANRFGGIKAKAALVSFYPLSSAEMRRAKENDIEVFSVSDLLDLRGCLLTWFSRS